MRFLISKLDSSINTFLDCLFSLRKYGDRYCIILCGPIGIGKTFTASQFVSKMTGNGVKLNSPYFCYYKVYKFTGSIVLHVDINRMAISTITLFLKELLSLYDNFKYLVVECVGLEEASLVTSIMQDMEVMHINLVYSYHYQDTSNYFIDCYFAQPVS